MKVYLATTSHDFHKAKKLMEVIRSKGHSITCDWTVDLHLEKTMSEKTSVDRAKSDTNGVKQADILIVVMQKKMKEKMTGAALEIGVAIGAEVPIAVVEMECDFEHFFSHHPDIHLFKNLEDVFEFMEYL